MIVLSGKSRQSEVFGAQKAMDLQNRSWRTGFVKTLFGGFAGASVQFGNKGGTGSRAVVILVNCHCVLQSPYRPCKHTLAPMQETRTHIAAMSTIMSATPASDVAFTPAVKAIQTARGSREAYAAQDQRGGFRTTIDDRLASFLADVDTAYLATANADGQPYAQHRGGPRGFIRVLDDQTFGFVDFAGNRQYTTTGNLDDNPKAFLFLMDYARARRIKIWGRARVVPTSTDLLARLMPEGYRAQPEHVILFTVHAWDSNCPQHIPRKVDAAAAARTIARLEARIADLESRLAFQRGP
eukprot:gene10522-10590_t